MTESTTIISRQRFSWPPRSVGEDDLDWLLREANAMGLLREISPGSGTFVLTARGVERLEAVAEGNPSSRQGFAVVRRLDLGCLRPRHQARGCGLRGAAQEGTQQQDRRRDHRRNQAFPVRRRRLRLRHGSLRRQGCRRTAGRRPLRSRFRAGPEHPRNLDVPRRPDGPGAFRHSAVQPHPVDRPAGPPPETPQQDRRGDRPRAVGAGRRAGPSSTSKPGARTTALLRHCPDRLWKRRVRTQEKPGILRTDFSSDAREPLSAPAGGGGRRGRASELRNAFPDHVIVRAIAEPNRNPTARIFSCDRDRQPPASRFGVDGGRTCSSTRG